MDISGIFSDIFVPVPDLGSLTSIYDRWKVLDFAALERSSVFFFNGDKQETAVSRWARARTRAAKVGKGLSKDEKAKKLALQHWLETIDPCHRYGHNLHLYYDIWFKSESAQPFFYWLDVGDGKEVNVDKCPRTSLHRQCLTYLGPSLNSLSLENKELKALVDLEHNRIEDLFAQKGELLKANQKLKSEVKTLAQELQIARSSLKE
ncbi:hypothetical protein ACS0TY_026800 [Phlomoides rotata]